MLAALLVVSLLCAPDARAQGAAPAQPGGQKRTRSGGRRGQADGADITADVKPLSCPKGFRAEKVPGPHLTPFRGSMLGGTKKKTSSQASSTFSRRCVPVKPAKPAKAAQAAPAAKDPPRETAR